MLKKLLNPFGIKITPPNNLFGKFLVVLGMLSTAALHGVFYYILYHFIRKFW